MESQGSRATATVDRRRERSEENQVVAFEAPVVVAAVAVDEKAMKEQC